MRSSIFLILLLPFLALAESMPATSGLVAPKFECDLPKFRASGDTTNETRQLRKIKRRLDQCIKTYKSKLSVQRASIVKIQQGTSNKAILAQVDEALIIIDSILASDLIPEPRGPKPDARDYGPAQHGGR